MRISRPSIARYGIRAGGIALAAAVSLTAVSVGGAKPAAAAELAAESFAGARTAPGIWTSASQGKSKHRPCLTAATKPPKGSLPACRSDKKRPFRPDPDGRGAFQLTDNSRNAAGALLMNKPVSAGAGLHLEFDLYQYNSTTRKGADGIAFFLIDGAQQDVRPGEPGGSLGYKGLKGALVGVGFDEYGNFSNRKSFASGPGKRPNTVVIRGAQSTKYRYVTGVPAPAPLAADKARSREQAKRSVSIDLSTANLLSVSTDFNDGKGMRKLVTDLDLDKLPGQPKLPNTIKFGFAASTGGATNYHEISGFRAATLDPKVSVAMTPEGKLDPGKEASFKVKVANDRSAGPTSGPVTATIPAPQGLTYGSASGHGWNCSVAGALTCTRTDTLRPGAAFPPITVRAGVAQNVSGITLPVPAVRTLGNQAVPAPPPVQVPVGDPPKGGTAEPPAPAQPKPTAPVPSVPAPSPTAPTPSVPVPAVPKPSVTAPSVPAPSVSVPPLPSVPLPGLPKPTGSLPVLPAPPDGGPVAEGPAVSALVSGADALKAGETGDIDLELPNAAGAAPTRGPVSATVFAPPGVTFKGWRPAAGWKCDVVPEKATCSFSGTLSGGMTASPVKLTMTAPPKLAGRLQFRTEVGTPGNLLLLKKRAAKPAVNGFVLGGDLIRAGTAGEVRAMVSNAPFAADTTGPVTLTIPAAGGAKFTGARPAPDWKCDVVPDKATCTYSGTLSGGITSPPVKLAVTAPAKLTGQLLFRTSVQTPGNLTLIRWVTRTKGPDLRTGLTASGRLVAGKPGAYAVTVTNAVTAGPTKAEVRAAFNPPKGITVTGASGNGWTCKVESGVARCSRPGTGADALGPGASYPAITVNVAIAADLSGDVAAPAASSGTDGEANPADNGVKYRSAIRDPRSWF